MSKSATTRWQGWRKSTTSTCNSCHSPIAWIFRDGHWLKRDPRGGPHSCVRF